MQPETRHAWQQQQFVARYGRPPSMWARAPGRVDLMGSHTDYNLGYVMTMTVDRDIWIAAAPRTDGCVRIASLNLPGESVFALDDIQHDSAWQWANYVRGVAAQLSAAGAPLQGFDGLIHSTVPTGSGLSSSAALELAVANIFQLLGNFTLDKVEAALLCQRAENQFVGVNCGILDQYSSSLGQAGSALLLDCRDLSTRVTNLAGNLSVVICDTRAERNLAGTEYAERRAQCEQGVKLLLQVYPQIQSLRDVTPAAFAAQEDRLPAVVARRCRFILEENQRVLDLEIALADGQVDVLQRLFAASYQGARDLYEIGAPALQAMYDAAWQAPGVIALRQAGAGFGGCLVALVAPAHVQPFIDAAHQLYQRTTAIEPHLFAVLPTPGAGPLLL